MVFQAVYFLLEPDENWRQLAKIDIKGNTHTFIDAVLGDFSLMQAVENSESGMWDFFARDVVITMLPDWYTVAERAIYVCEMLQGK